MLFSGTARNRNFLLIFLLVLLVLSACGSGRKKYLAEVMPLVEQNDAIDARVAQLPRINAFQDPDYLTKLDSYIASKQAILNHLETMEPPFLMATTHAKLVQAMKNGVRYLQSEREKFMIAREKMSKLPPTQDSDEFDIIREYQSQTSAYQADMMEQLMKQQYEKLYGEVREELERARKF